MTDSDLVADRLSWSDDDIVVTMTDYNQSETQLSRDFFGESASWSKDLHNTLISWRGKGCAFEVNRPFIYRGMRIDTTAKFEEMIPNWGKFISIKTDGKTITNIWERGQLTEPY